MQEISTISLQGVATRQAERTQGGQCRPAIVLDCVLLDGHITGREHYPLCFRSIQDASRFPAATETGGVLDATIFESPRV